MDDENLIVTPDGVECEAAVILNTKNAVDLYADSGDVVATNPDRSAGVKVTGAEQATCLQFFTERLVTFPDGEPEPLTPASGTSSAPGSPTDRASVAPQLETAQLTYFEVTINKHRAAGNLWGVDVSVCYARPHPGANADGTTRVSTDPWSIIVKPVQGKQRLIPVSQLRLSRAWAPSYGEKLVRVGQCREGWITVRKPDVGGSFAGIQYAPRDFPDDIASWTW